MDLSQIERQVRERLSSRRMAHTLGCAETAVRLAKRWGACEEQAHLAGLLHDITKELGVADQLNLCEKHGMIISDLQKNVPSLLHAITGAAIARDEFHAPQEVCSAIRWHTTGRANMSLLEKILWISDLIEPTRTGFETLPEIRRLAEEDLDAAVLFGMDRTIEYLICKKQMIDEHILQARNSLICGM